MPWSRKLRVSILTPQLKYFENTGPTWTVTLSWMQNAYSRCFFRRAIFTRKVGHTGLFLM